MENKEFVNETLDEVYTYRNIVCEIWNDDYGQCKFVKFLNNPLFKDEELSLGTYNTNYKEDINYIIDKILDTIYYFDDEYSGARLEWFNNNGYRDIQLVYRFRILKVFPLTEEFELTDAAKNILINESKRVLDKYIKIK